MNEINWLTQEAYDRLQAELAERETAGRAEFTKRIELAREEGDLKENAGYHAAKDEQGKNEARIRQLRQLLEHAQIGAPQVAAGVAQIGQVSQLSSLLGIAKHFYWDLVKKHRMPQLMYFHQLHRLVQQCSIMKLAPR